MSYNIVAVPTFRKELKKLAKKYLSLKADLAVLFESLAENPTQGTALSKNCYKIRLAVSSKGKGKSGGARIITNIVVADETVYLLSIYDKSEKETLTDKEINELLKDVPE
ncbi:mRNA-degrading endonuclease RelE, toxin component of the RelBE toxin-antitoxin system [Flexibacter flexilis DSM 6793]|uniref:mRNA-degrading endonuclease RelE, toxin component of the RelBE toxin-antitoxin system n=1 Tax=Flexibacter flexilis DSM 6793 TaxID=927664 RepID=A0A1I1PCE2_9BACT|nr:type II toxin-antitoxin system RelE/ParE family toxin [Flexibacter flexilis]SFD03640.1 mRNA-degrading endonuclease RelE, toxin component of the RelBE toxin-antitoxin system [Flexibacter flexilis DSM 6793]